MPINSNVYNVNWNKLVSWLTPARLFLPKVFALLKALVSPISSLHGLFISFRKQKLYDLSINSQVCRLEKLLNDKFDSVQRRIYITDGEKSKRKYIFKRSELVPLPVYLDAESNPTFIYKDAEITTITYHFIVNVPLGIKYKEAVINSLLNTYRLPSRKYKLETF